MDGDPNSEAPFHPFKMMNSSKQSLNFEGLEFGCFFFRKNGILKGLQAEVLRNSREIPNVQV